MKDTVLTTIYLKEIAGEFDTSANLPLTLVNDHVVRIAVTTAPYFWHFHPDSDETFLVLEGSIFIDLEDKTVEVFPNQLFTVPKNTIHCTRPNGDRSVNLTFESNQMTTIKVDREP